MSERNEYVEKIADAVIAKLQTQGLGTMVMTGYNRLIAMIQIAVTQAVTEQESNVIEAIAHSWDGCMHDDTGGEIDIGQSIREAYKRLTG